LRQATKELLVGIDAGGLTSAVWEQIVGITEQDDQQIGTGPQTVGTVGGICGNEPREARALGQHELGAA
jgi:hypothetical protein